MQYSSQKIGLSGRQQRIKHNGCVIWLTGLSGAGKSTIAIELKRSLVQRGCQVCILDGDNIRRGLCSDLGFSRKDRRENNRRIGEMAKIFAETGFICITAFISPYRTDRAIVRHIMTEGQFIEVFVNAPLAICEARDPKGLYAKARNRQIKKFTGISAPYQLPLRPEIELRTDKLSITDTVEKIMKYLKALHILNIRRR